MDSIFKYDPSHHRAMQNYLVLLIALVLLITLPPIAAHFGAAEIFVDICFSAVIVMGIYITTDTRKHLRIGLILGGLTFVLRWLCLALGEPGFGLSFARALIGLIFFTYISYHLARSIIKNPSITINTIYGAAAGFMILGIIGGQLFMVVELFIPEAVVHHNQESIFDYIYFSFVILTGIGFGDIVPNDPVAKSFAVILGIAGQLYLTVLIAILIGKYLSESNNKPHEPN